MATTLDFWAQCSEGGLVGYLVRILLIRYWAIKSAYQLSTSINETAILDSCG